MSQAADGSNCGQANVWLGILFGDSKKAGDCLTYESVPPEGPVIKDIQGGETRLSRLRPGGQQFGYEGGTFIF
jgi:hypothetical protein